MTPADIRALELRILAQIRRELEADQRRTLSDVQAEQVTMLGSMKKMIDASNMASNAPLASRLSIIESRLDDDEKLKKAMQAALDRNSLALELKNELETKAEMKALKAADRRKAFWVVMGPIVLVLVGSVIAAIQSHFRVR